MKFNKNPIAVLAVLFVFVALGLTPPIAARAYANPAAVDLLSTANFAILAGTPNITDAGNTSVIIGDVGLRPAAGSGIGLNCSQVTGTIYSINSTGPVPCVVENDALLNTAKIDLGTVYDNISARLVDDPAAATELGGTTKTAGVYASADTKFQITAGAGPLVLDGQGNPDARFIFEMAFDGTGLTVGNGSVVSLINGAKASNVFWRVTTATIGTTAVFKGNILALTQITAANGANIMGRLLARNGNVTLINDTIIIPTTTRLTVTKTVTNNNGGTKVVANFPLFIDGMSVTSGAASTTSAGLHTVSETADADYAAVIGGDCDPTTGTITLASGDNKTCTITNDDIAPRLTVTKTVTNDNNGVKAVADFFLFIDNMSVTSAAASTTSIGLHTVSETTDADYAAVIGGDCDPDGTITLALGDVKTCTIINNDIAPGQRKATINVVKTVINDNGGTKTVADFPLFANGVSVVSGTTNIVPSNLTYIITETSDANYTQAFSGDCDSSGRINLIPGDNRVCIITNDDIGAPAVVPPVPPLIDVVKVPSPLALPAGPGAVTYTYTLRNIGTVSATDITMVGDSCSPIVLASGDTNADGKLNVNETWVYQCSTILSETHTNTVTATGWANGISAVDIASATVVVGAPVVPPLIHVVKVPSPLTLPAPGGAVTYTYAVTNPGTEPLNNVSITDDKCTGLPGRVSGHPGDINKNNLLERNETWIFTCQSKLMKTTTNIGTAEGSANGLIARDFAIATVVVAASGQVLPKVAATIVPGLPKAGLVPSEENIIWNIIILSGIFLLASVSFAVVMLSRITK